MKEGWWLEQIPVGSYMSEEKKYVYMYIALLECY